MSPLQSACTYTVYEVWAVRLLNVMVLSYTVSVVPEPWLKPASPYSTLKAVAVLVQVMVASLT